MRFFIIVFALSASFSFALSQDFAVASEPSDRQKVIMDSVNWAKTLSKSAEEWRRDATGHSIAGFALMAAGASSIVGGFSWNSEAKKAKEEAEKYPSGEARDIAMETSHRYSSHAKTQFIFGGSFVGLGIILNLVADNERKHAEKIEFQPYITPQKSELGLALRF